MPLALRFSIDGCLGRVLQPVDVQALDCDFYVAGHIALLVSGIGFLFRKVYI